MTETISTESQTTTNRPAWFVLAAGPLIWALHLIASYVAASLACLTGFVQFNLLGLNGATLLVLGITLLAALILFYTGFRAYGHWRQ